MSKPYDTREVEYAYVIDIRIVPNIEIDGAYKTRISVTYQLKTKDREQIGLKDIEHYSDLEKSRLSADEVVEYINANLAQYIADDKLELSGFKQ